MSRAEYERLLLARRQPPFDQQLVERATYADLDEAKVRDFLRRRQEAYPGTTLPSAPLPQVVAEMLEGARERDGELAPTYTGLLFFGRNPQRFLPRAEVWTLDKPGEAARNQVFEPFALQMYAITGVFDALRSTFEQKTWFLLLCPNSSSEVSHGK